jgi:hypothetical protein
MKNLGLLGFYHAGPVENRMGIGHTVPIGEPWVPGSSMDYLLVQWPYPWGPKLAELTVGSQRIHVLWVLPIYAIEREFKSRFGLEALEQRFADAEMEWVDPFRAPVVEEEDLQETPLAE